jgi:hypothetical protein
MKKLIAAIVTLIDSFSVLIITFVAAIDFLMRKSEYGTGAALLHAVILLICLLAINFCFAQIISLRWPRTFDLGKILNDNHLMIEYQDLLDENDEETDCAELDIVQDEDYFEDPRLCACLLYDKRLEKILILSCPVYVTEGKKEIHTFRATSGLRRYYRLRGMEDVEGYENMEIEQQMLKYVVRVIMSIKRKDTIENAHEAYRYILETSDGFLPNFAIARKGYYNPEYIGPGCDDSES